MSDAPSWAGDLVAVVFGAAGAVTGGIALWQGKKDREIAGDALDVARDTADAARIQAEETREQRKLLVEQLHDARHPGPRVTFERRPKGRDVLHAHLTVGRDCVFSAALHLDGGDATLLQSGAPLHGGAELDFFVDQLPTGESRRDSFLELRFWPTADAPCPCDRPQERVDESTPSHWHKRVPVEWPKVPPPPMVAYGR